MHDIEHTSSVHTHHPCSTYPPRKRGTWSKVLKRLAGAAFHHARAEEIGFLHLTRTGRTHTETCNVHEAWKLHKTDCHPFTIIFHLLSLCQTIMFMVFESPFAFFFFVRVEFFTPISPCSISAIIWQNCIGSSTQRRAATGYVQQQKIVL